jgi:hypothetical protein
MGSLTAMSAIGQVLLILAGAAITWLFAVRQQRENRRRDAWAAWAQEAYRLMVVRQDLVEKAWSEDRPAVSIEAILTSFSQRVSRGASANSPSGA